MRKLTPIFTLSLSATLLMVGVGMIVALLPQRVHTMTGTLESVGLIASAFALAYLLAQLPIGVLSDRLGAKRFLVLGYVLCGFSGLVFFSARDAGAIYLGRAMQGLGEAPVWALGPALLSLAYPRARGRAIGIYNAAIHAGLTIGPLLGLLAAPSEQSGLPFLVYALLCFCAGAVVLFFLPGNAPRAAGGRPNADLGRFLAILRDRRLAVILAGILLYGAGYGVFVSILPISLTRSNGFGPTGVSMLFVVFYAAIGLAQIVAGPVSDRFGRRGFMIWGMLAAAAGIGAFPSCPGLWAYLPLGIASAGLGVFCVASIAELNDRVADDLKGAISGSYYFFWALGYVLGPLALGVLADRAPSLAYAGLALALAVLAASLRLIPK